MHATTRALATATLMATMLGYPVLARAQGHCGPIIVAGHDADDHGFENVYVGLFDELMRNLDNRNTGILVIGADPGTEAAIWIQNIASIMALPQTVTLVNDAAIATVDFTPFAIIHVPSDISDTSGGIAQSEADLLTARADDIASFQAQGGALFGLTQGQLSNGWSWIGGVGSFTHVDVAPSGQLPSGNSFDDVTATAEGTRLGITDINIDGCCFHNVFTAYPPWLRVLAYASEPADPAFDGQAVFVGGVNRCMVLSVTWRDVRALATARGTEVVWSTFAETDTLGYQVRRASRDGSRDEPVGDPIEAIGPLVEYRVLDAAPSPELPWYYVQEIASVGPASVSTRVAVEAGESPSSGGSRSRVVPASR